MTTVLPQGSPAAWAPYSASWRAIGTYVTVAVTEPDALETATGLLEDELSAADRSLSRFRSDSELSRVNRNAGRPVPVGQYLMSALAVALRVADMTSGLVDPLLGAALVAVGYDGDFDELPDDGPPAVTVRPRPQAWRRTVIDRAFGTVRIPQGTALDLGSTGKSHAADRAAHTIAAATGAGVLVGLGGDIAVGGEAPPAGWLVRVAERPEDESPGVLVVVRDGGMATSSSLLRRWRRGGQWQHHVIDPRTARPADDHWRTVTVAAGSCVDANAASTAAIVMGPAALGWLEERGLPARLVDRDGAVTRVGDWPADGEAAP
ncbi:FAD:protein FMN transferase [Acidothermaceae bacterium B102]|nr:FAD:protein FMN transferase [Acidothermaceae bacterium B102]